ncbi:MAG: hypothetical protein JO069_11070 [Verrucomicrobia bacterium]|nr:hypothetical protein [Verrucomicrobiota bacterium]
MWVRGLICFGVLVGRADLLRSAEPEVSGLRRQLTAAEEAKDKPAIIELSRRIVEMAPQDAQTWETLARTQIALKDYDRCALVLDAWEQAMRPRPAVLDDLRGDLAKGRGDDDESAERFWRAYVMARPNAVETLEKLADLCAAQGRYREGVEFCTRALAVRGGVADRLRRAQLFVSLRDWDNAFADIDRANTLDPTDAALKEALPQFEALRTLLPRIRKLDLQVVLTPAMAVLWLDRARLFTLANRPALALRDCRRAMRLAPGMMRARVQTGEALLDLGQGDDAAKLDVSYNLKRDADKHVNEKALRSLGDADAQVSQNPAKAAPLAARAKALRFLNQYVLALADAQAALALDPDSAEAHFQAAHVLGALDRTQEAMPHIVKATELNPDDAVMWYYRGLLEAQRANFDAAIQCQTRSLSIRESYPALQQRELCERRTGRMSEADADAARLRQLTPSSPE